MNWKQDYGAERCCSLQEEILFFLQKQHNLYSNIAEGIICASYFRKKFIVTKFSAELFVSEVL